MPSVWKFNASIITGKFLFYRKDKATKIGRGRVYMSSPKGGHITCLYL